MGRNDRAPFRYKQNVVYSSVMNANDATITDVDEWLEWAGGGGVAWNAQGYVTLTNPDAIFSLRGYQYGSLTFNAMSTDWSQVQMGFILYNEVAFKPESITHGIEFVENEFITKKEGISETTPCALINSTQYHFIIHWNPFYCGIDIYTYDGTLIHSITHRNPPTLAMQMRFMHWGGAGTLRVGSLCLYSHENGENDLYLSQLSINREAQFSINMEIENLAANQNFILIDLSDIVNFPHIKATGIIQLSQIDIFIGGSTAFRGDIELGFLENVGAVNSDTHPFHTLHLDQASEFAEEHHILPFNPWIASSVNHLSSARNLADVGFVTGTPLSSPFDAIAPYTSPPGNGDIYLRIIRTAGNVDISCFSQYWIK